MSIVTLLTDFGNSDTYVGQMKGAILSIAPATTLVDLSHSVAPQDVRAGAFLLWTAVEAFPSGSIHLAVVDPGVGSDRRAIAAASSRGDIFVGPDNGLLTLAVERLGGLTAAVELSNRAFWRRRASQSFHGRDIFAPVAAHLAQGVPLAQLGRTISDPQRPFSIAPPTPDGSVLRGEIIHIDHFGNLITNLPADRLAEHFSVELAGRRINGRAGAHFASVPIGALVALVGSAGLVEVAVRNGAAAAVLHASIGDPAQAEPVVNSQRNS